MTYGSFVYHHGVPQTLLDLVGLLSMTFWSAVTLVCVLCYLDLCLFWATISLVITLILFKAFRHVNHLLDGVQPNSTFQLNYYIRQHKRLVQIFLRLNRIFGQLLLAFLLANFPLNVYMNMVFIEGRLNWIQTLGLATFSASQFEGLAIYHLTAALYSKRIHQNDVRLVSLLVRRTAPIPLQLRLKHIHYSVHLHNKNRLGVTYGRFSLVRPFAVLKVRL